MKILLVDDHTLFRDALVQYLNRADPDAEIFLAKDFYEGQEQIKKHQPLDLVLLDLKMPGMNGLEGLKVLKTQYKDLPIALMSGVAESSDVQEALDLGANGYFPKTMSGKSLLKGIQTILDGERYIPRENNDNEFQASYYTDNHDKSITVENKNNKKVLSPREQDVLSFLIKGASNKEIALELGLQVVTVKLHVRGICRKLDAKNRTQAAIKARELHLISDK